MTRCFGLVGLIVLASACGCAHTQLQRNVNRQTNTLTDIYEQQVLDNLAKFVTSPGSMPSFAVPNGGGTTLNHSNTANGGLNWNPTTLSGATAGINGTRTVAQNWTLNPINAPKRLSLMKCVYQVATGQCPTDCEADCYQKLQSFFGEDSLTCDVPQQFYRVTEKKPCLSGCCVKYGSHCGTYLVVDSKQFECLSRLTLAILEIATLSDAEFAARFADSTVNITETFVANYNGKPVLVQGTRSIKADDYQRILRDGALDIPKAMRSFDDAGVLQDDPGIDPSTIQTLPQSAIPGAIIDLQGRGSSIESLLQLNQAISPQ